MDVCNVVGFYPTYCRRGDVKYNVPACFDWFTCEDAKKDGNGGPDDQDGAYRPGCDAESEIDVEDAI